MYNRKVFVSTVHKKGLEFEKGIIFEATDGTYPFFDKKTWKKSENPSFSMAMTRVQEKTPTSHTQIRVRYIQMGEILYIDKEPTPWNYSAFDLCHIIA